MPMDLYSEKKRIIFDMIVQVMSTNRADTVKFVDVLRLLNSTVAEANEYMYHARD
jgi:hypothetical protein